MVWLRLTALVSVLLTSACSPADLANALTPGDGVQVSKNIPYQPGPRHSLDIYRPRDAAPSMPLIVFLYGGNWQSGSKDMYGFVAKPLAERGAVVVVPDYRLAPQVQFPAFVEDSAAAVAWALRHAQELGADPRSVFVMGHSAGAYNAAMLALDPAYLARSGTSRAGLAGVAALSGPYDFLPITQPDLIPIFAPVQDGSASQPITYADGRNPPLLLLTGTADTTVMPRNTTSLARRITELGGPVDSKYYPDLGHIGMITAFIPLFRDKAPVLDDVWSFVVSHRGGGQRP